MSGERIKPRRFKYRMIIVGFTIIFSSGIFLWFLVTNPQALGERTGIAGTIGGLTFLGSLFYTAYAIKVKLRQHNLIRW